MNENQPQETEKAKLEREKLELEIQNLRDTGLSNFERTVKRRVVPVFLPFLTLLATTLFFCVTCSSNEKAKAIDRYNSEVDMINMVWKDIQTSDTLSREYRTSKDFLVRVFNANKTYYEQDNEHLGIVMDQRPIKILTNMNKGMRTKVDKLETNVELTKSIDDKSAPKKDELIIPPTAPDSTSVVSYKDPLVLQALAEVANGQMKVYIQYSDKSRAEAAEFLANELKPYYVVPPTDCVPKIQYSNQIRYYRAADLPKAKELAKRIREITGREFILKNIYNKRANVMEVWYDNKAGASVAAVAANMSSSKR